MHLDHDHAHEHPHEPPHDHPHEHPHEPPHAHPHDHACGEHIHCGEHVDCAACGENRDPRAELLALMRYMVGHNAQHAEELAKLARQLDAMGDHTASEQVLQAVSDFEKGNLRLSTVLTSLEHQ